MTKAEKIFCEFIHDFIKNKWDNIKHDKLLGLEEKQKSLDLFKTNLQEACWVLYECCEHLMDKKYLKEIFIEKDEYNYKNDNSIDIIQINEHYLMITQIHNFKYKIELVQLKEIKVKKFVKLEN